MSVEERLAVIEQEIAEIKRGMAAAGERPKKDWIARVQGSFKNDPDFGEILKLGREFRMADGKDGADGDE